MKLNGHMPLALLKTLIFLETLTSNMVGSHANPIYQKSKLSDPIIFVLRETDLIGVVPLTASLILSYKYPKRLPQTLLSLTMIAIKMLNNCARIDIKLVQDLGSNGSKDVIFHLFSYLLTYCTGYYDSNDDIKDLLNEVNLI